MQSNFGGWDDVTPMGPPKAPATTGQRYGPSEDQPVAPVTVEIRVYIGATGRRRRPTILPETAQMSIILRPCPFPNMPGF